MKLTDRQIAITASFALHAAVIGGTLAYDHLSDPRDSFDNSIQLQFLTSDKPQPLEITIAQEWRFDLSGTIDEGTVDNLINKFNAAIDSGLPQYVALDIDSPGGSVPDGYMIQDLIKQLSSETTITCKKQAASMAAIVLITTPSRSKVATPECEIMIHAPYSIHEEENFTTLSAIMITVYTNKNHNYRTPQNIGI